MLNLRLPRSPHIVSLTWLRRTGTDRLIGHHHYYYLRGQLSVSEGWVHNIHSPCDLHNWYVTSGCYVSVGNPMPEQVCEEGVI